jgi:hypothetical protein
LYASVPVRNVAKAKNANNNHAVIQIYTKVGPQNRVAAGDSLFLTIGALSSLISDQWTNKKRRETSIEKKMQKMAQDAKKGAKKKARKKGARRDKKSRRREARSLDYLCLL